MGFKKKLELKDIILLITILILIIVNLVLLLKKIVLPKQKEESTNWKLSAVNETTNVTKVPQTDDEIIRYLSTLNERARIEYYCGQFIKYIKYADYSSAYGLLYDEFKQNYFPTEQDFANYITEFYPKFFALEYDDISMQGDIYVIRLKVINTIDSNAEEKIQRIVIKENYYNDFVMSFQVEQEKN